MANKDQKWPTIHEWPAERVTPGDVIYGARNDYGDMVMYRQDDVFRVTSIVPSVNRYTLRVSGVTLEGLDTWLLLNKSTGVAIAVKSDPGRPMTQRERAQAVAAFGEAKDR